jgi:hypothetical protein
MTADRVIISDRRNGSPSSPHLDHREQRLVGSARPPARGCQPTPDRVARQAHHERRDPLPIRCGSGARVTQRGMSTTFAYCDRRESPASGQSLADSRDHCARDAAARPPGRAMTGPRPRGRRLLFRDLGPGGRRGGRARCLDQVRRRETSHCSRPSPGFSASGSPEAQISQPRSSTSQFKGINSNIRRSGVRARR